MSIQRIQVTTAEELESAVLSYLAQGFVVANRSAGSATLQKKKEFSALWAVVGFLLCILPLLIYLIVYAMKADVEIIEVKVQSY